MLHGEGVVSSDPVWVGLDRRGPEQHYFHMADIPFDTLAVTRRLEAKGFDAGQTEAITEAVRAGVTGGVATKADLTALRAELKGEINELRAEFRTELKWIKLIGVAILAVLILPWLVELLSATLPGP